MIFLNKEPISENRFPDGTAAPRIQLPIGQDTTDTVITWKYDDDSEVVKLIYVVSWLREHGISDIVLNLPYIPNARMDRVKNDDEVFTLKYFANIINSLNFKKVITLDPHSYVSEALIDRIIANSPNEYIEHVLDILDEKWYLDIDNNTVLFFPDEGAMKRYSAIANEFHLPYVFGMKKRDWRTGDILGLDVCGIDAIDNIASKNVLIIDDISSKGGTFYHSAKALKELGFKDIYLYISHCENIVHEGDMISSGLIKEIFTTDSIYRKDRHVIKENETPIRVFNIPFV